MGDGDGNGRVGDAGPANGLRDGTARAVALVGPQGAGKTTLLESLLVLAGAVPRKGRAADGSSAGDATPEARARHMSTELNVASVVLQDDAWTFLDCPGAVELAQEARQALMVADAAVVVVECDPARALAVAPLLRFLDERAIPHMVFVNKVDGAPARVRDVLQALQAHSARPLVLRQVPIREGEAITGYVDLVSERAYHYEPGRPSALVQMPDSLVGREQDERQRLVETLADFDDALMEQVLEDVVPPKGEIYAQIAADLADDRIVPVLIGAAEQDYGVRRLAKALRHEVPNAARTARRLGLPPEGAVLAQVFRVAHGAHAGRLALARVWHGRVADGMALGGGRVGGLVRLVGAHQAKVPSAGPGEVVALVRLDGVAAGDLLTGEGMGPSADWPAPLVPVHAVSISARDRKDEVKLSAALKRLVEEDPSLVLSQDAEAHEILLAGQGEVHLHLAIERLKRRHDITVDARPPRVAYRETIRRSVSEHARFKRQSGGHGQFADVHLSVGPLPAGTGHRFASAVIGGSVPKQYVPGVEAGAADALRRGPLGFPVVDVEVVLTDGQHHSVDSSEQAFRTAARQGVAEALAKAEPVLLEPIDEVVVHVPAEFTARAQRLLSSRRGQILGFDARADWPGWDEVKALVPSADLQDLIVELRSLTLGVGGYERRFSHYAELAGKAAQRVIEANAHGAALAHS